LRGEKIDIVRWSDQIDEWIANALSPSKVVSVTVYEEEKMARVVVPDHQLSLAIGKEGQNARLAAKLTNWKIDIKSESEAENDLIGEEDPIAEEDRTAEEEAHLAGAEEKEEIREIEDLINE
jgi:transcription termination/antitermination protein NusA